MPLIQPVRLAACTGPPDPARPAGHCRRRKMRLPVWLVGQAESLRGSAAARAVIPELGDCCSWRAAHNVAGHGGSGWLRLRMTRCSKRFGTSGMALTSSARARTGSGRGGATALAGRWSTRTRASCGAWSVMTTQCIRPAAVRTLQGPGSARFPRALGSRAAPQPAIHLHPARRGPYRARHRRRHHRRRGRYRPGRRAAATALSATVAHKGGNPSPNSHCFKLPASADHP